MIYQERRKFSHNGWIKNTLGMDIREFVKMCHQLSADITDVLQRAAYAGVYGKNDETFRAIYEVVQAAFPGREVVFSEEQINLEGVTYQDNRTSFYGTISFFVDGKELKNLYFEKPYSWSKGIEHIMSFPDGNRMEPKAEDKSNTDSFEMQRDRD